ncbi:Ferredoxin-2 [Frankia canadensis]|uniref:Ferredoxin n=1 Tax=Frankia canadensis TaxID=1836972 RepID=A0A2I2KMK0_9ACTN|nr:ferredoxin [Frankia canadensis]SNQ46890.1 Ferredoxin-2 [Frankia canadensis]SOU54180.1 Ferredoxin-2 [Frankia canadensis]
MRVNVDFDRCASSGTCVRLAPDIFEIRDDGYLYLLNGEPDDSRRDDLQEAVDSCPTEAISLSES